MRTSIPNDLKHYPDPERHRSVLLPAIERAGTPLFLCQRDNLTERFRRLQRCLSEHWEPNIISYSFKTNYLVAKCGIFRELGAWAEVVSGREYRLARACGFPGTSIVFNGPYKSEAELGTAISEGALVNLNDQDELESVLRLEASLRVPVEIGLRLSFTLPRIGHSRFGFSLENQEAQDALDRLAEVPGVRVAALHMHLYGDTDDPEIYRLAAGRLARFAADRIPNYQRALKYIDVGGGFPAHSPRPNSRESWNPQPIEVYIGTISQALRTFFPERDGPTLIVEPGRYLTCDGIFLVTRVIHVKERDGRRIVNCNGSISMMPLTHYCPQIIRPYTEGLVERSGGEKATVIYGSTCRENDRLYEGMFPATRPGDYLIHFAAGAYNSSLSPDFIFEAPGMDLF